jgi:hypothetical protein
MKKIILKSALLLSLTIGLFIGCAPDDYYTTPENTLERMKDKIELYEKE